MNQIQFKNTSDRQRGLEQRGTPDVFELQLCYRTPRTSKTQHETGAALLADECAAQGPARQGKRALLLPLAAHGHRCVVVGNGNVAGECGGRSKQEVGGEHHRRENARGG